MSTFYQKYVSDIIWIHAKVLYCFSEAWISLYTLYFCWQDLLALCHVCVVARG